MVAENTKKLIKQKGLKQKYVADLAGITEKKFSSMLNAELSGALFRMFGDNYKRYWDIKSSPLSLECKINGNMIIFRGVNDEKQREKLKSITFKRGKLTDVWIEEATDVCACGFGYMYAFMSAEKRTSFMYADCMGVAEVMAKDANDNVEYVVYWYIDRVDKGNKKIKRIQVWDNKQVTYFTEINDGEIILDTDRKINPRPHIVTSSEDSEDKFGSSFGYIPFFRIDADRRQTSHLKPVKALIDDYDLIACGLTNNIQDIADAVYVVKGFEGENFDELQKNIKTKKMIGVSDGGGVEVLTTQIPVEARKAKLELDEKNIYRFGMGFNSAQVGDGNITNIVLKSRYALLDMKCNKLEKKLRAFLKGLIKIVLDEINGEMGTAYSLSDVEIRLTREIMSNALDNAQIDSIQAQTKQTEVNTLLNAASQLGEESVLEALCNLLDLDIDKVKEALNERTEDDTHTALNALESVGADSDE